MLVCSNCEQFQNTEWRCLTTAETAELNQHRSFNFYTAGTILFHQGNPSHGIYCVNEGTIALRHTEASGASIILRLVESGQTLGCSVYFEQTVHTATAVALTDCRICFVDKNTLRKLLKENRELPQEFLKMMAKRLHNSQKSRAMLTSDSVRQRLAHVLIDLKDRHGNVDTDGNIIIDLPMQRQDLAALLGTRPETLSRAIHALSTEKVVQFSGRKAIVRDLDELLDEVEVTV